MHRWGGLGLDYLNQSTHVIHVGTFWEFLPNVMTRKRPSRKKTLIVDCGNIPGELLALLNRDCVFAVFAGVLTLLPRAHMEIQVTPRALLSPPGHGIKGLFGFDQWLPQAIEVTMPTMSGPRECFTHQKLKVYAMVYACLMLPLALTTSHTLK